MPLTGGIAGQLSEAKVAALALLFLAIRPIAGVAAPVERLLAALPAKI